MTVPPEEALIVFAKNPVPGAVKTRLAATVGNEKALEIYKALVACTQAVTEKLRCDKWIYYSDAIAEDDGWANTAFKAVQSGSDLGERMKNAFADALEQYNKAVIIGTDCPCLESSLIEEAFAKLDEADVVLGPAADGGYYLLGMKALHPALFEGIAWSTATVLSETMRRCQSEGLAVHLLPVLSDIDDEEDWKQFQASGDKL